LDCSAEFFFDYDYEHRFAEHEHYWQKKLIFRWIGKT